MSWILINCALRGVVAMMMVAGIVMFEHWLTRPERVGMGLIGSSVVLTIPVIVAAHAEQTPFDDWASCLTAVGLIVFFFGWMRRKWRHDQANREQARIAKQHFAHRSRP